MRIDYYPLNVSRYTLIKGKELYEKGAVKYLETLEDGICFEVLTTGFNTVFVALNKNLEIDSLNCTCKEFALNNCCKHSVAVVYYYCNSLNLTPLENTYNSYVIDENNKIICKAESFDFSKNRPEELKLGYISDEK